MIKIITVSGTRPDFIRLIPTIRKLDKYFDHKLVWAGQNYDPSLSTQFFKEFNRIPDIIIENYKFGIEYTANILTNLEEIFKKESPNAILVLGDTHSAFAATYVAKRLGIKTFHLEAGNRCFDPNRVPEEVNRYMIDSIADWHLTYTQRSREHLLLEGKRSDRVIVVGNPMAELMAETFIALETNPQPFYLVTIHRKENIEDQIRLLRILYQLNMLDYPVKLSYHPSLKNTLERNNIDITEFPNIQPFEPSNFKDFLSLEINSRCIITDSGTIPEEAYILRKPCVLLRYSTERPELLESNAMVLCSNPLFLKDSINIAIGECDDVYKIVILDYHEKVSSNIVKLLMRCIE